MAQENTEGNEMLPTWMERGVGLTFTATMQPFPGEADIKAQWIQGESDSQPGEIVGPCN